MFKNKHILVATVIAPILAIIAWFATDIFIGETPIEPQAGKYYKLVEKPNCRWESGVCGLKNNDLELEISLEEQLYDNLASISLEANVSLEGVRIGLFEGDEEIQSKSMSLEKDTSTKWKAVLAWKYTPSSRIRVAVQYQGAIFYGDVSTQFTQKKDD